MANAHANAFKLLHPSYLAKADHIPLAKAGHKARPESDWQSFTRLHDKGCEVGKSIELGLLQMVNLP